MSTQGEISESPRSWDLEAALITGAYGVGKTAVTEELAASLAWLGWS